MVHCVSVQRSQKGCNATVEDQEASWRQHFVRRGTHERHNALLMVRLCRALDDHRNCELNISGKQLSREVEPTATGGPDGGVVNVTTAVFAYLGTLNVTQTTNLL